MSENTIMQAPKNVSGEASIMGHQYKIPANGKIKVVNPEHVDVLKRHGFVEAMDDLSPEEIDAKIEAMDDKDELVQFIEERGGEADNDMSFKKLRRLARQAASGELED